MSPKEETLRELAEAMLDQGIQRSTIPAAYTYLGQLLAHDMSHLSEILTDFGPVWENEQSLNAFHFNALFGTAKKPGVKSSEWLEVAGTTLGMATDANHSGSQGYDLPRLLPAGAHCCQDPRTDSNLALAQMHVLLVRFHQTLAQTLQLNTTVAIRETRRHLQAVIATDYLHRIIPEDIYTDVMQKGRRIVAPEGKDFLVSLEFAVAVFRFGHSMVRPYYFPWQLNPGSAGTSGVFADISSLLSFVSGGGALTSAILPNGWSQFWHHMCGLDLGDQNDKQVFARPIGTRISAELGNLQKSHFPDVPTQLPEFNIAFETMRRGRRFNLPSGQQIAAACNEPRVLDVRSFLKVHPKLGDFAEDAALCKSTPLWFYTLAEAEAYGTDKLGPVAARIVMETFHAALEKSPDSILSVSEAGASEINFERKVRIGKGARAAFSLGDVVSFSYQTEH